MFTQFDGLPVHPLVVHAVVVLLPAAVLGTIAVAVRPAWRRRYGTLVVGVTASRDRVDPGRHVER